jgi:hypothetical protein
MAVYHGNHEVARFAIDPGFLVLWQGELKVLKKCRGEDLQFDYAVYGDPIKVLASYNLRKQHMKQRMNLRESPA